uniref:Uncharacterized protein n=1 Tax=Cucumis melo TaxID=3656 RepID=A0A9I9E8U8_CUCME
MEEELLDRCTNTSLTSIVNTKILQQHAPQGRRIMAIPKGVIMVFLRPLTKQGAKRPNKRRPPHKPIHSANPTKQNFPNEEPDFHRNLGPPNHMKNELPRGGRI